MSATSEKYDVVIVGGGPAGASAAIHLATAGARVALAEQKNFPRAKLCGEFISPECLEHFARLGVEERMLAAGGKSLAETVFYSRRGGKVNVPSAWFGARKMALGLSRAEMDHHLLVRAREAGAEVFEETQGVGLLAEQGRVRGVRLKRDAEMFECSARVVVDATGRQHALSRFLAQNSNGHARAPRAKLVAFKAHLENARGTSDSCEIYFYRGGYGGLSRVENGLSNLCFIANARDVRLCGSDAARVMREVVMSNLRAHETLKDARPSSEWLAVALDGFGRRALAPADGLIAIGDAASFIDPFTGSGMLMALESGELAAQAIARWLSENFSDEHQKTLAEDYRALYSRKFDARLRVCALMRRAAFVPRLAEAVIFALGKSDAARRRLARATRKGMRAEG
ncbi:MAG TPA: FAD-dependent oxidoreductase [Pyrinomonadaceae bacterium]|nr:FAD-dependent oxidoreductase [Pyrinomonadaceae bacterium]